MNRIADSALGLVGIPFRHQGRNPSIGLDCVGVWVEALRRSGVPVRDCVAYRRLPDGRVLMAKLREQFRQVARSSPGDLLVLRVPRSTQARHVGIDVGDGWMVHANASSKVVRRERYDPNAVDAVFRAEVPHG